MKLIEFPEQNTVFAEKQPQYRPLPAYRCPVATDGLIVCCWGLTWRERLSVLLNGRIWHQVLTFNKPLQPQKLTVEKPEMTNAQAD